ncbi:PREDICTED: uncharacterized protein LOC106113419 [Papilio xuthus]|uniref:Uncharacterized protein LOC106113419 n=1 Tax=Papilio xuthus TaxID=66420 RepID=A0AAJ7E3T1_PAPXU|nr:PREDICTED: uncharacterized protein LOC106113419 [Papilio xuthus]
MKVHLLALGFLHMALGLPVTLNDLQMADDTMSVGTYVREVRAASPDNYHKSYENEGDGEIGYARKKSGGGKKGYQHFDSFHKKAGDHYEFEKEDSYGLDKEEQEGAHSHRQEKAEKYREPEEKRDNEEAAEEYGEEKQHEELKLGGSDGNGGVEAHGHNPDDYKLPEKYSYGAGEEYDF